MIKRFCLILTLMVGVCTANEIRLADSMTVRAPTVTLGEIATIDVADSALRAELAQLKITEAPRIGSARTISSYKVQSMLDRAGIADVKVRGLKSTVTTESRVLRDDELRALIESWVYENAATTEDIELDVTRLPYRWNVPAGDALSIQVESPKDTPIGTTSLTLRAVLGTRVVSTQRAQAEIRRYREVPVIIEPMLRGQVVTPEHIQMERREVTRVSGMEVQSIDDVLGLAARRNLAVGLTPKVTDFEPPLLVERGEPIRVVIQNGSIQMKVAGAVALEDGHEGDTIMLSNPMNEGRTLRARVVRRGLAVMKLN